MVLDGRVSTSGCNPGILPALYAPLPTSNIPIYPWSTPYTLVGTKGRGGTWIGGYIGVVLVWEGYRGSPGYSS